MILYSIRRGPNGHTITKFDDDFNPVATYDVTVGSCTCPAGPRPTCRHRKMLPRMLPKVGQPEFYCYETQSWHRPIEAHGAEPSERGASEASEFISHEQDASVVSESITPTSCDCYTMDECDERAGCQILASEASVGPEPEPPPPVVGAALGSSAPTPAPTAAIRRR